MSAEQDAVSCYSLQLPCRIVFNMFIYYPFSINSISQGGIKCKMGILGSSDFSPWSAECGSGMLIICSNVAINDGRDKSVRYLSIVYFGVLALIRVTLGVAKMTSTMDCYSTSR